MLLYVAGPYGGDIDRNIAQAREIAIALWERGHAAICPHLNTAHFEIDCRADYEDYLAGDFNMISRVDGLVMTPDWESSPGAKREKTYAESLGMGVWIWPDIPDIHLTEKRAPQQCQAFRETVGRMYRTHLSKNADYSPANVLGPGELGLVTRLWDKVTRLMNLSGFNIVIASTDFVQVRTPKHEAIEDTYLDMAVYAIIGLLLRAGKWGK